MPTGFGHSVSGCDAPLPPAVLRELHPHRAVRADGAVRPRVVRDARGEGRLAGAAPPVHAAAVNFPYTSLLFEDDRNSFAASNKDKFFKRAIELILLKVVLPTPLTPVNK